MIGGKAGWSCIITAGKSINKEAITSTHVHDEPIQKYFE